MNSLGNGTPPELTRVHRDGNDALLPVSFRGFARHDDVRLQHCTSAVILVRHRQTDTHELALVVQSIRCLLPTRGTVLERVPIQRVEIGSR